MNTSRIPSPDEFFGFKMGTDGRLARWDKIVRYFNLLGSKSNKMKVIELGKSTGGHPFLAVVISSPQNIRNLERLRSISQKLADPRGLREDDVRRMVRDGKAVVVQSMSLHASEVGGTQMSVELAHELLTSNTPETKMILEQVLFLMVPCFNPDGQIMVTDWYEKYKGTKYEGGPCRGSTTNMLATTITGMPSHSTRSNHNTWRSSSSEIGCLKPTSTITTWAAMTPA